MIAVSVSATANPDEFNVKLGIGTVVEFTGPPISIFERLYDLKFPVTIRQQVYNQIRDLGGELHNIGSSYILG